jgi:hypothetical protein
MARRATGLARRGRGAARGEDRWHRVAALAPRESTGRALGRSRHSSSGRVGRRYAADSLRSAWWRSQSACRCIHTWGVVPKRKALPCSPAGRVEVEPISTTTSIGRRPLGAKTIRTEQSRGRATRRSNELRSAHPALPEQHSAHHDDP